MKQEWTSRGVGSWREVSYSSDNELNWFQIENYGDLTEPMYMCLSVDTAPDNENSVIGIGSRVILNDCSYKQDTDNNEWIGKETKFEWDENNKQILFVGNRNGRSLCVKVNGDQEKDEDVVELTLEHCDKATTFVRDFTP